MNADPSRSVSRFFPMGGNVETDGNKTGNGCVSTSQTTETTNPKNGNGKPSKAPVFVSSRFHQSP
jgi:hypothetical protein